jgi:hypothetical protein
LNKTIYTSNYARKGSDPNAYAISAGPPKWYAGKQIKEVAPSWDIVMDYKAGVMSKDEYVEAYVGLLQLRRVNPHKLIDSLPDNSYLLCYESPKDFCHRQVLSAWIEYHTNASIEEWKNEKEQKEAAQWGLVEDLLDL